MATVIATAPRAGGGGGGGVAASPADAVAVSSIVDVRTRPASAVSEAAPTPAAPTTSSDSQRRVTSVIESVAVDSVAVDGEELLINQYRVLRPIGQGAYGTVVAVEDTSSPAPHAVYVRDARRGERDGGSWHPCARARALARAHGRARSSCVRRRR